MDGVEYPIGKPDVPRVVGPQVLWQAARAAQHHLDASEQLPRIEGFR